MDILIVARMRSACICSYSYIAPLTPNVQVLQEVVVYGIVGFIQLHAGEYMIVITGYERVGSLNGKDDILRATTFQILPLPHNLSRLSEQQIDEEQTYVHLLQDHLRQNTFYYSYTYDLTRSIQRQHQSNDSNNITENSSLVTKEEPLWKTVYFVTVCLFIQDRKKDETVYIIKKKLTDNN